MEIKTLEYYHGVVVELRGRYLGSQSGDEFRKTMASLRQEGKHRIVIDLSRTELMDSTALGTLIGARSEMIQAGGDVRVTGIEQRIRGLFLMTHLLGSVFVDYVSREAALASYRDENTGLPVN